MIRKSRESDYNRILEIYERARQFMRDTGNPRQWNTKWPPAELIAEDIKAGKSYVYEQDGVVEAAFYYDFGEDLDPTYRHIEDGAWIDDSAYGVVHRIASSGNAAGAGRLCIEWALAQSGHLRIDTHGDNKVMRHVLESMGFERCGIIYVEEDNDPRIAYER